MKLAEAIETVELWIDMWEDEQVEIEEPTECDMEERKVIMAMRHILKAVKPPDGIEEVLDHLRGNKETFRESLSDKNKLLASVCDYAKRVAKRKKLEPWSIVSDMTDHGSGVSSAIYELYRRKE